MKKLLSLLTVVVIAGGVAVSAQWDPWPFSSPIKTKIEGSDIYTLRRIVPADRGESWDKT